MWFVLFKVFRIGYSEAKKRKAKKQQQQQPQQFQGPYPPHPAYIPDGNHQAGQYYYQGDTTKAPFPEQTELPSNMSMSDPRPKYKQLGELILQVFQFAFALAVIGLYGQDLNRARDQGHSPDARWVYAETTGFLSSVTAALYLVLGWWFKKRGKVSVSGRRGLQLPLFVWEAVVVILWLVVFGIFADLYIGVYYEGGNADGDAAKKVTRMRRAVWVDLASLVFWIASAGWRGVRWWKAKGAVVDDGFVDEKEMV